VLASTKNADKVTIEKYAPWGKILHTEFGSGIKPDKAVSPISVDTPTANCLILKVFKTTADPNAAIGIESVQIKEY
jgi:hypothetical protein